MLFIRTPGHTSYDIGRFARATASDTLCSWCATRIRRTDADTVGTWRSCRNANRGRTRANTVPRTIQGPGTWSANGRTGSFRWKSRCSKLLNAFHRFLTWLTMLTAVFQTSAFLVQREALVAGVTFSQIARYAAHGTLQTFVAFLVRVIEVRAFRMARAFEFEITRLASYTLVLIRSGTRLALSIARATPKMIFKTRLIIKAFMAVKWVTLCYTYGVDLGYRVDH
ncbi:hypothetical protein AGLY_005053 [Aphis glycines]|uniref:Uncharacterized protein n=1 Tax=Aphis glycines TaxID=307491 RepID=A0A6G0TVS9_APHGL|nr:hypothetical protein AGLY_005053 [Aphis glycines]